MSLKGKTDNIFQSSSQVLEQDPASIRMLQDRVLLRDLGEPERVNGIWIPQTAAERGVGKDGLLRLGIVVAVGPGNTCIETGIENDGMGPVKRRIISKRCEACGGNGRERFDIYNYQWVWCQQCNADGSFDWCDFINGGPPSRIPVRVPCTCKVGDKVIYERRRESEVYFWGHRFSMVFEEQAIVAIVGE